MTEPDPDDSPTGDHAIAAYEDWLERQDGPTLDEQAADALAAQMRHVAASHARMVERGGWSRQQWIADAEQLMHDVDGSVLSLVNGHVTALIDEVRALQRGMLRIMDITTGAAPNLRQVDGAPDSIPDSGRLARIALLAQDGARAATLGETRRRGMK